MPHFTKKKETDVLLPEGYKQQESRFVKATIVDVASDCTETLRMQGILDRAVVKLS